MIRALGHRSTSARANVKVMQWLLIRWVWPQKWGFPARDSLLMLVLSTTWRQKTFFHLVINGHSTFKFEIAVEGSSACLKCWPTISNLKYIQGSVYINNPRHTILFWEFKAEQKNADFVFYISICDIGEPCKETFLICKPEPYSYCYSNHKADLANS